MSDLHYITAVEALRRFTSRDLSPVELMQAVIARAEPALDAGEDYVERMPCVNGVEQQDILEVMMTILFNLCSRCPAMSVPSGRARTGVPTGVQIVGRTYDDVSVFRAAAALERLRPWLDTPERRPALA